MTIEISNIEYDLYDPETNPYDDILPRDLELPSSITVSQKFINENYDDDDFDIERDLNEVIVSHTGFDIKRCTYEIFPDW